MKNATRLTHLEVMGERQVNGAIKASGLKEATYKAISDDAEEAAGEAPTKAEFDAAVTLLNELKTKYNKLLKQLLTGSDT